MGRRPRGLCGSGMIEVCVCEEPGPDKNRYTMFYPLYPVGIGAEWWLMFRAAVGPAGSVGAWLPPVFYFLLALYVPGECGSR